MLYEVVITNWKASDYMVRKQNNSILIHYKKSHDLLENEWYRDPRARGGPWRLRLRCRPKGRGISPYVSCTLSVMDQ